jgi:hypothetical protein
MNVDRDPRRRGLRMVRAAMAGVIVFALAAGGWIAVQALRNPDVRARRPGWLEPGESFNVAYWTPLLLTVLLGAGLVLAVLARAHRRLVAGEDLFAADDALGRSRPPEETEGNA